MKEKVLSNAPNPILKIIKASGLILVLALLSLNFGYAQNDNANENATVDGGYISTTDATTICLDGIPDPIDVILEGASGRVKQWIITDDQNNILALPDGPPFDFDQEGVPPGVCRIWHLSYNGIKPLWHKHLENLSDLVGRYDLSNYIEVTRQLKPTGGTLEGGPFDFCVGDGESDYIPEGAITLSGNSGTNAQWLITDDQGTILGLPPSPYLVDFDGAGDGTCLVWHLMYEDGLQGAEVGANAADLDGCFELSNPIEVIRRQPVGGTLEGGPFDFCVGDGEVDNIPEGAITLSGNSGTNSQWVITDDQGTILGLPPSPYVVDFDGAGAGTCLVWHLSFEDGLQGAAVGENAADLSGCFDLSNYIEVIRRQPEGGTLEGGPFEFCVGNGEADNIAEGAITLSGNSGTNSQWVITDDQGNILGLPPSPYGVDFDGAGAGTCLVWHLSFEDGLQGAAEGNNAADLVGCYSLSNPIEVIRIQPEGGTLEGGPFEFTVGDNVADTIPEGSITLTGNSGTNSQWVITDEEGKILGLPASPYEVDFEGAGAGTCLIWHLSYEDGLEGAVLEANAADLVGCFSLSNSLSVIRTAAAGRIAIYPNPTDRIVNIDVSGLNSRNINISVFNMQNVQLFNSSLDSRSFRRNGITTLNVNGYARGIYFVQVTDNTNEKTYLKRLVVN